MVRFGQLSSYSGRHFSLMLLKLHELIALPVLVLQAFVSAAVWLGLFAFAAALVAAAVEELVLAFLL